MFFFFFLLHGCYQKKYIVLYTNIFLLFIHNDYNLRMFFINRKWRRKKIERRRNKSKDETLMNYHTKHTTKQNIKTRHFHVWEKNLCYFYSSNFLNWKLQVTTKYIAFHKKNIDWRVSQLGSFYLININIYSKSKFRLESLHLNDLQFLCSKRKMRVKILLLRRSSLWKIKKRFFYTSNQLIQMQI